MRVRTLVAPSLFVAVLQLALPGEGANSTRLSALGPSSTSAHAAHVSTDIPIGKSVPGDYGGKYRPQVHFSAPKHFMSDPNGLFKDESGTWHMYYQYNPRGIKFSRPHWGHATSKDLYHCVNQPVALFPPGDDVSLFSGSIVVDANNTSGLFPNQTNGVVAIYVGISVQCYEYVAQVGVLTLFKTLSKTYPDGSFGPQTQALAYSHDGGFTFTPYKNNPIINSTALHFRDPKIMFHKNHWIMTIAYPQEFTMGIFSSENLIDWKPESNFSLHGLTGFQWECPNLVHLPHYNDQGQKKDDNVWTLFLSVNPGGPLGGSFVQYYPGKFNGTHFEAVDSTARFVDAGKDYFAMQFFNGLEENDAISMAWASNWQYTLDAPTDPEHWRGTMSLPRKHHLTRTPDLGWKLVSRPYKLQTVMADTTVFEKSVANKTIAIDFSDVASNAIHWEMNVTNIPPKQTIGEPLSLNFTFMNPGSLDYVRGGYYFGGHYSVDFGGDTPLFLDRSGAKGFENVFFTDKFFVSSAHYHGEWSISGVLDRSIMELFLNGGLDTATMLYFPSQPLTVLLVSVSDVPENMHVSVRLTGLKSSWNEMMRDDGLVHGNETMISA